MLSAAALGAPARRTSLRSVTDPSRGVCFRGLSAAPAPTLSYADVTFHDEVMIDGGGGAIVNIASVTSFMGVDVTLGYGAAKTGILGLIRGMAVDLGKRNIRVNAVAAGLTQTGMTSIMFDNSEWTDPVLNRTPLQRLGKPDDIAGAVLFASSSAAQWMTGQALVIDGGFTIFG